MKKKNKLVMKVFAHQDINSNVFKAHVGPVETCKECQRHPRLVEWNMSLKKIHEAIN